MNIEKFTNEMERIAKLLKKKPEEISKVEFTSNTTLTLNFIKEMGGFDSLKELKYPVAFDSSAHLQGSKIIKSFKKKIENKMSVDEYLKNEFLDVFKEELKRNPPKLHKPISPKKTTASKRTIVAHISDTHFGANIEKREMGQINEFNWSIASRRMGLFAEQVVQYKPQHRKETDLVVALNGDIIAGMIHDQEWFADLLTKQVAGSIKLLTQFVSYVAGHFNKVKVVCTVGNHGRAMHKSNKSRATTHKWDSYENMIYIALKYAMEAKHKNVTVEIPVSPYAIIDIQGHKFLQTHGDTVLNVGNPGSSINMKSINTQINRLNSSDLASESFAGILVGHVHVSTVQITDNGTVLLVNGTLSGADPYVQSIGIFSNEPTQMMFEVTKDHAVGDIRFVRLQDADKRVELEKIIEPLINELE